MGQEFIMVKKNFYLCTGNYQGRQTDRHTDIQTYRHTDIQTYRHTDIMTDIQTDIHFKIQTYKFSFGAFPQSALSSSELTLTLILKIK